MPKPLSFQQIILKLQDYWTSRGCTLWQPYNHQVGAGTYNPATSLRVLGPEPWNVAYVEPSIRTDDGRYGENPNRLQQHTQFQVILKPDPGNPQEIYLESLFALGIKREEHDIRFVEDNWESPALGAWGLGWEVWLDGLEITQFTYFQQAGGVTLDPVSVEITYGLERIAMFLQGVRSVYDIDYDGVHTYGDIFLRNEIEQCIYNYEVADVERLHTLYDAYEAEAKAALAHEPPLVMPAHDYVLKCSHTFNLLDSRGAIGVTERANYFRRMRDIAKQVAQAYLKQREAMEYPWLKTGISDQGSVIREQEARGKEQISPLISQPSSFVFEIGTEELPAKDVDSAIKQLQEIATEAFKNARLENKMMLVYGTPRRLALLIGGLEPKQTAIELTVRGPAVKAAFDKDGKPTKAAEGFAKSQGVSVNELIKGEEKGAQYVFVKKYDAGRPTAEVLATLLPELIAAIKFEKVMRWNNSGVSFSRPIRWIVALFDNQVIPFEYAGVESGNITRGSRAAGSPEIAIAYANEYQTVLSRQQIEFQQVHRHTVIRNQIDELLRNKDAMVLLDSDLDAEVTNLVEQPTALLGHFEEKYLKLPQDVLITVMKKHQRYFPIEKSTFGLLPNFITIRNGDDQHLDVVRHGNEEVIRARFADAEYFFKHDRQHKLADLLPRLGTLTFQVKLGSMLDKAKRIEALTPTIAQLLGLNPSETKFAERAAHLSKADLASQMVIEMTSLQGLMGREYAKLSGESNEVANAIGEQYDRAPSSKIGAAISLADRFDSLAGLFAIGLAPTGSADPWALRRAALGIVETLITHQVPFSLKSALEAAAKLQPIPVEPKAIDEAHAFIIGREKAAFLERGLRYDLVDAILAARGDDPFSALQSIQQLSQWVSKPDWSTLLDGYARCVRIVRELKGTLPLDMKADNDPNTQALHAAYQTAHKSIGPASSIEDFCTALKKMIEPITAFFDKTLVMHEDPSIRQTRQALLQHIWHLADGIVDLTKVEGF